MNPVKKLYEKLLYNTHNRLAQRKIAESGLDDVFAGIMAVGYSDAAGIVRPRSLSEMERIRHLLITHMHRFLKVSLLGCSDEILELYKVGFERELAQADIDMVVDSYREEIRLFRNYSAHISCKSLGLMQQNAFKDSLQMLAHLDTRFSSAV